VIHSIGHSTHSADDFAALLRTHGIRQLADVRSIPHSRRHPHFGKDALDAFLGLHGIAYRHFPGLGGRRRPGPDSTNSAWREDGFRGYADYMQTPEFDAAVESLIRLAETAQTVVMCAESVWWRCHRRLLSDALLVRGVHVFHILSAAPAKPHELSEFACVAAGTVTYPGLL
jgi:uncharacterized protein (DUF488 family)